MSATADAPVSSGPVDDDRSPPRRRVRRRRGLPGGRAVVGGLLITVAAVAVFAAYLDATAAPTTRYVVTVSDVEPGTRVQPADLGVVAIDLPSDLTGQVFTDPGDVVGQVVTAPLGARELVAASDVADPGDAEGRAQQSFSVGASRALGERIRPGERIDVLATYDDYTLPVLSGVRVLQREGAETVTFTVALEDPEDALALANAVDSGEVTVVRTTELDPRRPLLDPYTPPEPEER